MKKFISIFAVLACVTVCLLVLSSCSLTNVMGIPNGDYAACDSSGSLSTNTKVFTIKGASINVANKLLFMSPLFIAKDIKSMTITVSLKDIGAKVVDYTYTISIIGGEEQHGTLDIEYENKIVKLREHDATTWYYFKKI